MVGRKTSRSVGDDRGITFSGKASSNILTIRDIVIAEVDREWTMKFFRKRGAAVFLEAANKDYRPIHPQEELEAVRKPFAPSPRDHAAFLR